MKYRILELNTQKSGKAFFVETGIVVWEKAWWIVYLPKTVWTKDENENKVPIEYDTFADSLARIAEIKRLQPIVHQVK